MFDSDTMLITDNETLIRCAMKYYFTFKVPTMLMNPSKLRRKYTNADKADLDKYCDNDNIGIIVNLSQELNSKLWDAVNRNGDWDAAMKAYYDNCLLSVLSGAAIDMAKREYPIDCIEELQIVRDRYDDRDEEGKPIRPYFFAHVAKKKGYYSKKKNYMKHLAPMDFVQEAVDKHKKKDRFTGFESGPSSIGNIFNKVETSKCARSGYTSLVLSMIRDMNIKTRMLYQSQDMVISGEEKRRLASLYFERCVNGIKTMNLNDATMQELLVEMDKPENTDIKRKLWSILFGSLGEEFLHLLNVAKEPISTIEECKDGESGDVNVFWLKYRYVNAG